MKIISHRGNLYGPNPQNENTLDSINKALLNEFDVEIDLWYEKGRLWLGHDLPVCEVHDSFVKNPKLWCHAKNIGALRYLQSIDAHAFYHTSEDVVLTTWGRVWTSRWLKGSDCLRVEQLPIAVVEPNLKELPTHPLPDAICTDFPIDLRQDLRSRFLL